MAPPRAFCASAFGPGTDARLHEGALVVAGRAERAVGEIERRERAIRTARVRDAGWQVVNVDVVVIAERPKIGPHAPAMQQSLATTLGVDPGAVAIKGKTNEGVDSMGAGDSIAVHAVALLTRVR